MKSIVTLRFLCVMSFLLLLCPFYDSCNIKKVEETYAENPEETTIVEKEQQVSVVAETDVDFSDVLFDFFDFRNAQNAIELASMVRVIFECDLACQINGLKTSIRDNEYKEIFFWLKNISFLIIIVLTYVNLVLVFRNETKLLNKIVKYILILLLITIACLFLEELFKSFDQIKWGYYSFVVINVLIFFVSRKILKPTVA